MRRSWLGVALVIYGVVGLALILGGAATVGRVAAQVEELAGSADGLLASSSRTLSSAATALDNVDEAMGRGRSSSESAATLARDASVTFASMAVAMEISIFGVQPLLPLGDDFRRSGAQAAQLAVELDGIAEALDGSRTDLAVVAGEMRVLVAEVNALRLGSPESGRSEPPLRPLMLVMAAWLAVPAIAALAAGIALLFPRRLAQSSAKNGSSP